MKKLVFMFVALAAVSFSSCDSKKTEAGVATDSDSVATVDSLDSTATDSVVAADSVTTDSVKA